jgi:hypothetical protein
VVQLRVLACIVEQPGKDLYVLVGLKTSVGPADLRIYGTANVPVSGFACTSAQEERPTILHMAQRIVPVNNLTGRFWSGFVGWDWIGVVFALL